MYRIVCDRPLCLANVEPSITNRAPSVNKISHFILNGIAAASSVGGPFKNVTFSTIFNFPFGTPKLGFGRLATQVNEPSSITPPYAVRNLYQRMLSSHSAVGRLCEARKCRSP